MKTILLDVIQASDRGIDLKFKYKVGDFVLIKEGRALARLKNPDGKLIIQITKLDEREKLPRYYGTSKENDIIYIYLETEIESEISEIFNPSFRNRKIIIKRE